LDALREANHLETFGVRRATTTQSDRVATQAIVITPNEAEGAFVARGDRNAAQSFGVEIRRLQERGARFAT
jgi:hypothetical protein